MPITDVSENPWSSASAVPAAGSPSANVTEIEGNPWETPSAGADVLKSFGTGVGEGLIGGAGSIGSARSAASSGIDWLGSQLGATPQQVQSFKQYMQNAIPGGNLIAAAPTGEQLTKQVQDVTGPFYQPQTTAGEYARTAGQFSPALAGGSGGLARRAITDVALPALASEGAGQLTKGTDLEPYARAIGGISGALAGGAVPALARRAVTPFPVAPERQAMLQTLQNEGVQVPASMATGNTALKAGESQLGGATYKANIDRMNQQFTQAALRKAGIEGDRATPEVLTNAREEIGSRFDALAARNQAPIPVQGFRPVADAIRGDFADLTGEANPLLDKLVNRIGDSVNGRQYQAISSDISRGARATSSPELRSALYDMKSALDQAIESGLKNPADRAEWGLARTQWRNLLTIEKAAGGPTEGAAYGLITPNKLSAAIGPDYVRGKGDFADLARAGNAIMKPFQDSGTTSRAAPIAKIAAMGGGFLAGGIPGLAAAGAASAAPFFAGKALMLPFVQRYLANQALGQGPSAGSPLSAANLPALLAILNANQQLQRSGPSQ